MPPLICSRTCIRSWQETLFRRGLRTPETARAFLDPLAYAPTPPTVLPGLASAAEYLETAIRKRQKICVWGDFDVDGQTSTTILFQTLQELGADVTFHIPVRAVRVMESIFPQIEGNN